jgi:diketogulonate reductase-like aldo/keto reductase
MASKALDLTPTSTVDLLAPGVTMPRLGFGIYRVQPSETVDVVLAALDAGYRHIDSAQLHNNEAELGRAIRQSGVDRKDVFLTTKIRYPGMNRAKTWKRVLDSVKKVSGTEVTTGRKRKRVDDEGMSAAPVEGQADIGGGEYVDLFLVHTPYGGPNAKKERMEMWLSLERAFEEGKARSIGVSNYKVEHLEEMREYAKVWPPHVNQIQVGMHALQPRSPRS